FYFEPVPDEDVKFTLNNILAAEGYEMEDEAGDLVVTRARGDLRAAINALQMLCNGTDGMVTTSRTKDILQTSGVDGTGRIVASALHGNFNESMVEYHMKFKGYAGSLENVLS